MAPPSKQDGRSMRRLATPIAILLVAALVAAAILWLRDDATRLDVGSGGSREGASRELDALPAPADATPPAARLEQPRTGPVPEDRAPSPRGASAIAIDGSIALWADLDAADPLPPASGSFELTIVADGKERRETLIVDAGRFRSSAPPGALLEATKFELGGRTAWRNGEIRRPLPDDGKVAMNAVLLGDVTLHVVDAATEAELRDVTLVATSAPREHPGVVDPADLLAEHRASPIVVGPFVGRDPRRGGARVDEQSDVWVGAPDHAWVRARLDFDASAPREMRIPLVSAGSLVVELRSAQPIAAQDADALQLRLSSLSGERTFLEAPVDARRATTIAGIEPGRFQATVGKFVEIGDAASDETWGEARIEIVAGTTTRVTIDVAPPAAAGAGVPVAGTLEIASSWGAVDGVLVLEPVEAASDAGATTAATAATTSANPRLLLAAMQVEGTAPRTLGFATRVAAPGRWRATVASLGLEQEFDVGAAGVADLRLVAPESAELRLSFADARTQQPIAPIEFRWAVGPASERTTWTAATVPAGAPSVSLRVPIGPLVIWADREGYGPCAERFDLQPGVNERRIELDLPVGLRVTFKVAGAPVEVSLERCPLHVRALDGDGELVQWGHAWQVHELHLSAPGRYHVRCDELAGYAPVPPFELELARGALQDVTIELERTR